MRKITELEKILLENPFDIDTRLELAQKLFSEGEETGAKTQLDLVLKQDSNHTKALELMNTVQDGSKKEKQTNLSVVEQNTSTHASDKVLEFKNVKEKIGFSDIVGMEALKRTIRLKIIEPFRNPTLFSKFKKKSNDGILLYGPPGCGKTMLAKAIASECNLEFIPVDIAEILNMYVGESERNLANVFERARSLNGAVLFFDELDALAISRNKTGSHSARTLVNELLNQMDGLGKDNKNILILGATNMPWDVDPAAKRTGRFSRLVFVPPLDHEARKQLLRVKLHGIPTEESINLDSIANLTQGFSGADITGIVELAKEYVLLEIIDKNSDRKISEQDLKIAVEEVEPSTQSWLKTAENLVRFGGVGTGYKDLAAYFRKNK